MEQEQPAFKHIVRIAKADLQGKKPLIVALTKIKGVGHTFANMLCIKANIDKNKRVGYLETDEVATLTNLVEKIHEQNVPTWMLNRRKDPETNEDTHLFSATLSFTKENDIKKMIKKRSYKGVRHMFKLPVRGQRTKSNFRKNKGKVMGVSRKKGAKTGK